MSFNFMAAITVSSDFEPKNLKSVTISIFPPLFAMKWWDWMPWSSFSECWALSQLFHSPLSPSLRGFILILHFLPWVVSSAHFKLWIILAILIPDWASSSPAFHMMYPAYKLNRQDDNMQPGHTPLPILNQSIVSGTILAVASWSAYRFLRRQVRWSGIPIS